MHNISTTVTPVPRWLVA